MHLTLCLPGLVWPHAAATGQTPQHLPTAALDDWLRFGNMRRQPLAKSALYAHVQSYPSLLEHCKRDLDLPSHQAAFLVSPVLQRVDLHSMSISDGSHLGISRREAVDLCRDINAFVKDSGCQFLPYREYLWLVAVPTEATWHTPPLCDIEGQLKNVPRPECDDKTVVAALQTLQAELQMLLAGHPVNAERKKNYQPEINGLWFWRDLRSNTPADASVPLMTDAPLLAGSARKQTDAPYDWAAAEAWLSEIGTPTTAMLWLSDLEAPSAFADMWGYQDAFAQLNERFLQPLQDALTSRRLSSLTLLTDGAAGFELHVAKRNRWAFWQKSGGEFARYLQDAFAE